MFVQLLHPINSPPSHVLGRVVVDPNDPLKQYAPPVDVWTCPPPDSWTTKTSKSYHLANPREAWATLRFDDRAMASVRALFNDVGGGAQCYFVVGATLDGDESITELDYAEVNMNADGSFDFQYEDSGMMIVPEGSVAPVRLQRSILRSGFEAHIRRGAEAGWKAAQATQVVAGPALTAAGFTAAGIAKKTFASQWQSGLGAVARGSTFSRLQSFGARGGLPVFVIAGVGLAVGGIACAISYLSETGTKEEDGETSGKRDEWGSREPQGQDLLPAGRLIPHLQPTLPFPAPPE